MSRHREEGDRIDERPDVSSLDDQMLVQRLSRCQFDAMAELYERHGTRVRSLATDVWGSNLAALVVQEVFGHLWQSPESYVADRGSIAVHLSMQVRLWEPRAGAAELDALQDSLTTGEQRLRTSGLDELHRRIADSALFDGADASSNSDRSA